jgi:hypothetical protein
MKPHIRNLIVEAWVWGIGFTHQVDPYLLAPDLLRRSQPPAHQQFSQRAGERRSVGQRRCGDLPQRGADGGPRRL